MSAIKFSNLKADLNKLCKMAVSAAKTEEEHKFIEDTLNRLETCVDSLKIAYLRRMNFHYVRGCGNATGYNLMFKNDPNFRVSSEDFKKVKEIEKWE